MKPHIKRSGTTFPYWLCVSRDERYPYSGMGPSPREAFRSFVIVNRIPKGAIKGV